MPYVLMYQLYSLIAMLYVPKYDTDDAVSSQKR